MVVNIKTKRIFHYFDRYKRAILRHRLLYIGIICAGLFILSLASFCYILWRDHQPVKIIGNLHNIETHGVMRLQFSHEVSPRINYTITPGIPGTWKTKRNLLGVTELAFRPSKALVPGSTYKIVVGHVAAPISNTPLIDHTSVRVTTETPADIASISPTPNAIDVPVTTAVSVTLKHANHGLRRLALSSTAPIQLSNPESKDDTTFTWHFASSLPQGATYQLTLRDLNQDAAHQVLIQSQFTTVAEPHITATDKDHFYPGDKITINFDQSMDAAKAKLHFDMPGSGSWANPSAYVFTPGTLAKGTTYSFTIGAGTTSQGGGVIAADHTFHIATPGAVYVTGFNPGNGAALNSAIVVAFDQPVDHNSAQAAFRIQPAVNGSFSWSGNSMVFHPSGLASQTTYTVTEVAGVGSVYGLPSNQVYSHSFSTTYTTTKLSVPGYMQDYALSCEESALRMILAYRGIYTSDYDILMRVGYNPRPRDRTTNSWDNPYNMFVGDVNGAGNSTGYGVYAPPVAAAARSYGRSASSFTNVSPDWIADQILNDNPVVLWGFSSVGRYDPWNTSSGVVGAYIGEHARTVYGVVGRPGAVQGFYLHDPLHGDIYMTTAQLVYNLNIAGSTSNQAVVVY